MEIEQAVRTSHCSHPFKEQGHACVGTCKITPKGVELECSICGDGADEIWHDTNVYKLSAALTLIGVNLESHDPNTVRRMLQILF